MRAFPRVIMVVICSLVLGVNSTVAQEAPAPEPAAPPAPPEPYPWLGVYPMSFFTKARSTKTVGKGHLSICLKLWSFDFDERRISGEYCDFEEGESYRRFLNCFVAKYGWAEDHHVVLGIPYLWSDYHIGAKHLESNGFSNVFLFDKWNPIKETRFRPAVSFDTWIFLPTGDPEKKLGLRDTSLRFTTTVSKAWEDFSLHFNPGYTVNLDGGPDLTEINAAMLLTPTKKLWPGVEYNYFHSEGKGESHDIIPGFIWKYTKGASFKLGAVVNIDSTMPFRDELGVIAKVFYRF